MMKNILNKKLLVSLFAFSVSLSAGVYDNTYVLAQDDNKTLTKPSDKFMNNDFLEIIRFDMLDFSNGMNNKAVDTIINKIKSYDKTHKKIDITIIGHTQRTTDDANEVSIDSKTYANKIQNLFRNSYDDNESKADSKKFALSVQKRMIDSNISKNIITVEYRADKDLGFTDATTEGIELSNRVMVSMYVRIDNKTDNDKDGIFDYKDDCLNTPLGVRVNQKGCAIDCDLDGVPDYKDKCLNTPLEVNVTENGCPYDSDKDSVYDHADVCPDTPLGTKVDMRGCALKSTLKLLFKVGSDKILTPSEPAISKFATFMKNNPSKKVKITGHTDSVGKARYNMLLSQNRALKTKEALVADGVDASRITTNGRGELDPIQSNRTKEGRKANRRIEVELF